MRESIYVLCWGDENLARPHPAYSSFVEVFASEEEAKKAQSGTVLTIRKVVATADGADSDVRRNRMAIALHEANIYSVPYSHMRAA